MALVPPAGVCWGALFVTGRAEMCADPPNVNVGTRSAHGTPSATTTAVGGGLWWCVPFLWGMYRSHRPSPVCLHLTARERRRRQRRHLRCSPDLPRPTRGRYKPFEYSPQRTPSGTFEPPDLMLTWGGRTPSHRRANTRGMHYFGSGAFCCDLLPAPVHSPQGDLPDSGNLRGSLLGLGLRCVHGACCLDLAF